jgi:ComF family protein
MVRDANIASVAPHLSPSLIDIGAMNATTLLPFRVPLVRSLIHEAKYHNNIHAQELLGRILSDHFSDWLSDETALSGGKVILIPIPLSASRRKERGFNQCEVFLQKALAVQKELCSSAITLDLKTLVRIRDTEHQTRLTRNEREANLKNAFLASGPIDPGNTYILFDDVLTTGATFSAAASALASAGAIHILPLALAR